MDKKPPCRFRFLPRHNCISGCGQTMPHLIWPHLLCYNKHLRPLWNCWLLSLARGFCRLINPCEREQKLWRRKEENWDVIWEGGGHGRAIWLLVSGAEIPIVGSLCSGDVDDIVKHSLGWQPGQDCHLFTLVSRSSIWMPFSIPLPPLLTPPLHRHISLPFSFVWCCLLAQSSGFSTKLMVAVTIARSGFHLLNFPVLTRPWLSLLQEGCTSPAVVFVC